LSANDERDEELANAVALEVHGDGQPDRSAVTGFTVRSTMARIGPSMPRPPHVVGGLMRTTSEVLDRFAPPMRRVVRQCVPTGGEDDAAAQEPLSRSPHSVQRSHPRT
jgi:hypothetical protein